MCGIGVTSLILNTFNPEDCNALIAASLPAPGPFTITSNLFNPTSSAFFAKLSAILWAAKDVDFLEPLNPTEPAPLEYKTFPVSSVRVMIVLLNVAEI